MLFWARDTAARLTTWLDAVAGSLECARLDRAENGK